MALETIYNFGFLIGRISKAAPFGANTLIETKKEGIPGIRH